jgi:hydrogenase maturation protein HypF
MLPSTPLHHLLLRAVDRPLVMTSGNASDEPICTDDDEALERLGGIADAFVLHDRRIVARYDDSVVAVRTGAAEPTVWRRARSFAPHAFDLVGEVPRPILGTGALLHGAFCLAAGRKAFLSQHVGDLDTEEAMEGYRAAYDRSRELFRVEPEVVAHDLHPDLMTTRFAEGLGLPRTAVQHHHAHVAATMAEHGLEEPVVGLAFDGLGLGEDGTVWGGEVLVCDPGSSQRAGHLRTVVQPGGDAATTAPWRMALAHAADAGVLTEALALLGPPPKERDVALAQLASGFASPLTSSVGRLFDAVAALAGICGERATYEGQPASLLEQAADPSAGADPYRFDVTDEAVIDPRPAIAAIVEDLARCVDPSEVAARFHTGLARAAADAAERAARRHGLDRVVLGGGVFHNDLLTRRLVTDLDRRGLQVFLPRDVPVGDGGIALGQIWVAAHREVT